MRYLSGTDVIIILSLNATFRVLVIIFVDSMGETAIKFMSQGKLSQRFPFQVVGKVNFKKPETIAKAIKKLTDSGIKRVLMMMHSRHVEAILTEVKIC